MAGYTADFARIGSDLGIEARIAGIHDAREIERTITALAMNPRGSLIALPDEVTGIHGPQIMALAATHRIPAVFTCESQVRLGGLAAYTTGIAEEVAGSRLRRSDPARRRT